ncbi:major facilitator superfamily domain-containing protein [Xylariaceae sp. FL1019]|nr:major facilitator superfamily domain-containing protein [Xylariaceae sp. FL1019]
MSLFLKPDEGDIVDDEGHEEAFSRLLVEDTDLASSNSSPKSNWEMLALTISLAGLQAAYCSQFAEGTDFLLNIGVSPAVIASVWIIPPLCGASLQPLFGILSDKWMARVGRREPFILLGGIGLVLALLLQAWSSAIAATLDTSCAGSGPACLAKVVMSVFAIILLYTAAQAVQVGARAKMIDSCNVSQQLTVNTWASRVISLTSVFYYTLSYTLPALRTAELRMQELALISVIIIVVTISLASVVGLQLPPIRAESKAFPTKDPYRHTTVLQQAREVMTVRMAKILAVLGLASFAWFPYLFYISRYITEKTGASDARLGPLALFLQSSVYVITSLVLPYFVRDAGTSNTVHRASKVPKFSAMQIWRVSQAIYSICVGGIVLTSSTWLILVLAGATGVSWAVTMIIPYTILTEEFLGGHEDSRARSNNAGMFLGINNLSITVPQIIAGLLCTTIFSAAFEGHTESLSEAIRTSLTAGSVVSLLATALLICID